MLRRFRNYFLSGLLVVVPIGVTIWIIWGIFVFLDAWFQDLLVYYDLTETLKTGGWFIPQYGVGFLLTILIIGVLGFTTQLYIGRKIFDLVDLLFLRTPFISTLYKGLKQISEALMGKRTQLFEKVVLIEYPRKGIYSFGFVTGKDNGRIEKITGKRLFYVFLPTTPNPTSGYFLIIPEEECALVNMSVEDAMKMVISGGMVSPPIPISSQNFDVASPPKQEKKSKAAVLHD
ncbi:MAG: DUF502 domain-containing protein [Candidatus Omnitrophota bacterium]